LKFLEKKGEKGLTLLKLYDIMIIPRLGFYFYALRGRQTTYLRSSEEVIIQEVPI